MRLPTLDELDAKVTEGLLSRKTSECGRLMLYNYTPKCQFDSAWDNTTRQARGLVFEVETGRCVARPFPKFFNWDEPQAVAEMPDRAPDCVSEKLDGSLGVGFSYGGKMWWCTRGAFNSEQARAAADMWNARHAGMVSRIGPGQTLLVEILHPVSRVVVHYEQPELVLLAVRDVNGGDWPMRDVQAVASNLGMRCALTSVPKAAARLKEEADKRTDQFEGFVLRWESPFASGQPYRVKVKGRAYLATHRLIQGLTERRAADLWYAGISLPSSLPEEIRGWYGDQCAALDSATAELVDAVEKRLANHEHITDRKSFVGAIGPRTREFRGCIARFSQKPFDAAMQVYQERFDNNRPRSCADFEVA